MTIDRKVFFKKARTKFGKFSQSQVDGFSAIFDQWSFEDNDDLRHLAYMLATVWHETARTMRAIEEYGKGKKHTYGKVDLKTGCAYYGRGLVQLTWAANYKKMGEIIGHPLYYQPWLALDKDIAVEIMFEGMLTRKSFKGDFTGKALENYFNKKVNDPIGARRIINGTDKAKLIAGYHTAFLDALG